MSQCNNYHKIFFFILLIALSVLFSPIVFEAISFSQETQISGENGGDCIEKIINAKRLITQIMFILTIIFFVVYCLWNYLGKYDNIRRQHFRLIVFFGPLLFLTFYSLYEGFLLKELCGDFLSPTINCLTHGIISYAIFLFIGLVIIFGSKILPTRRTIKIKGG